MKMRLRVLQEASTGQQRYLNKTDFIGSIIPRKEVGANAFL